MKSKNEKVPEFDDIIFKNRNKQYGAYNLRKQYKSAASFSILGGVVICTLLITAFSFSSEPGTANPGQTGVTILMIDPVTTKVVPPPIVKPPAAITNMVNNLKPEVTEDSSEVTQYIPTTDQIIATTENGDVNDTIKAPEFVPEEIPAEAKVWVSVQEMPEFPGGEAALLKYIGENTHYPPEAQNNNIQGKVLLRFVITPDGSVNRVEILRSVDPALDSEAVRVVSSLPKFKPGKQNGVPVNVAFSLPVSFRIENN
jgi:periplasmic protein TonB